MFFACFLLFFYKSEKKHVFMFFYLQINVFNIYARNWALALRYGKFVVELL